MQTHSNFWFPNMSSGENVYSTTPIVSNELHAKVPF